MDYIFDIVKESLKDLESGEDREFIRDLSISLFADINNELKEQLVIISRNVDTLYFDNKRAVYTFPTNKADLEEHEDLFFPMYKEDIKGRSEKDKSAFLRKIYADLDYFDLKKILNKKFIGEVQIEGESHKFDVYLIFDNKYLEKEEEFFKVLNLNNLPWEVLYTPYSRRFFNVYIENLPENLDMKKIKEIKIDYEEYSDYIFEDHFLAWNVEEKSVLVDKIRVDVVEEMYKYRIFSNEAGSDLVKIKDGKIFKIERDLEKLYVYSDTLNDKGWALWNIKNIVDSTKYKNMKFKPVGNKKINDFITRFKGESKMRTRSEAEIYEIINSYTDIENISLEKIRFEGYVENVQETYDMNAVFNKGITLKRNNKQNLNLYFKILNTTKNLIDELSFALSCVEYKYPEYSVRGVVKWQ